MVHEYFASVKYKEGVELNNTEVTALGNLAQNCGGSPYERASNPCARLIAFTFPGKNQAEEFKRTSETLEKIVLVRIGKM